MIGIRELFGSNSRFRQLAAVLSSRFFDRTFYTSRYPDVPKGLLGSALHYIKYGGNEGLSPHRFFDSRLYLEMYPDVKSAGINPLLHFLRYGKQKNRIYNRYLKIHNFEKAQNRTKFYAFIDLLLQGREGRGKVWADLNKIFGDQQPPRDVIRQLIADVFIRGEGVEVGALQDPLKLPNEATVKYVDRLAKEDLYAQYPELRGAYLVDVDIIDNGEKLGTLEARSVDFIVANHFLEHTQDPIATLKNFCRVVKPGGLIYLAVPNQMVTFDQDREVTTLAHLIEDHLKGPQVSKHKHFREWVTLIEPHFGRTYQAEEAIIARVNELLEKDYSIHFHCWRPADFDAFVTFCETEQSVGFKTALFCQAPEEMVVILRVE